MCLCLSLPPRLSAAGEAELCPLHPQLTLREAWTVMLRHQSLLLHFQVLISGDEMPPQGGSWRDRAACGVGEVLGGRESGGHAADSPEVLTVLLAGLKGFWPSLKTFSYEAYEGGRWGQVPETQKALAIFFFSCHMASKCRNRFKSTLAGSRYQHS